MANMTPKEKKRGEERRRKGDAARFGIENELRPLFFSTVRNPHNKPSDSWGVQRTIVIALFRSYFGQIVLPSAK
jgi:hypothetical protein